MSNEKCVWRKGSRFTAIDATEANAEMDAIRQEKGQLTADLLLERAKDGSNILHSAFEWDDSKAGRLYRRSQAMQMIKSIEVIYEETPAVETTIKYWQIVEDKDEKDKVAKSYVTKEEALMNPEQRAKMVSGAYKMLRDFRKKYKELDELDAFHSLIDSLVPDD